MAYTKQAPEEKYFQLLLIMVAAVGARRLNAMIYDTEWEIILHTLIISIKLNRKSEKERFVVK